MATFSDNRPLPPPPHIHIYIILLSNHGIIISSSRHVIITSGMQAIILKNAITHKLKLYSWKQCDLCASERAADLQVGNF